MVSLPTYDNNLFARGISSKDFVKLNTDLIDRLNRSRSGDTGKHLAEMTDLAQQADVQIIASYHEGETVCNIKGENYTVLLDPKKLQDQLITTIKEATNEIPATR